MAILSKIKEICNDAVPEYGFEFEHSKMMNVKADNASFPLIFFEEYTDGKITQQMGLKKAVMVELSFMRLCPMHNDAVDREAMREQIEVEAILPFIKKLQESPYFEPVKEFSCMPEPPRFDANTVSVMLRFWVTYRLCAR